MVKHKRNIVFSYFFAAKQGVDWFRQSDAGCSEIPICRGHQSIIPAIFVICDAVLSTKIHLVMGKIQPPCFRELLFYPASRNSYTYKNLSFHCTRMTLSVKQRLGNSLLTQKHSMNIMTSSNGNIFRVAGRLCGKFTGPRWIHRTKASDAELWCFLWSASE